ncbi:hypothetical protein DFP72DRAFT_1072240 [Ephemerocybe angulata]|uniref:Uncharacterized protein n=1 Tax=Ephemerocybe angulata TaxID=980116 RepID=A0A8H6HRG1_9AGAR|nr:hypothetical protein DFP72DRAFT_1072240 [Tulosesus angulatus]
MDQGIPQEVFDHITDATKDMCRDSLPNLSLTSSRHFLHRAQSHIFWHLEISKARQIPPLLEIMDSNPDVLKHAVLLQLYLHDIRDYPGIEETVACLSQHLTGLRIFRLQDLMAQYSNLSPDLQASLALLLAHPITSPYLPSIDNLCSFPLDAVQSLSTLRKLELGWNGPRVTSSAAIQVDEVAWRLTEFICSWRSEITVPLLLRCPRWVYGNLVVLDIGMMTVRDQMATWSLLDALSGSGALKFLTLRW